MPIVLMIASRKSRVCILISIFDKFCLALINEDVSVAPFAQGHNNEHVDLGEHVLVYVIGLPSEKASEKN